MRTLILLMALVAGALMWSILRPFQRLPAKYGTHDAIEYYAGWDGYGLPLRLSKKITPEEAKAYAARGAAYLIGYFDEDGKLVRNVKMYQGSVFFEHEYAYHPGGQLKSVRATNPKGVVTTREYEPSDRPGFVW
jgi:hypothetical protein